MLTRYTHGPGIDEPLAEVRKHRTRFFHADTLGSIIALTEKHGHPVRHYGYSAFGIPEDHRDDPSRSGTPGGSGIRRSACTTTGQGTLPLAADRFLALTQLGVSSDRRTCTPTFEIIL